MPSSKKTVMIQYRKADDPTGGLGNFSLEQTLRDALAAVDLDGGTIGASPKRRHFDVNGYGTLVLNNCDPTQQGFFGEIVRFEPGADLTLLEMIEQDGAYNLKTAKAPSGHEPFKGILYFLAVGSHVIVLEQEVSSYRAEQYLTWLIGDRSKLCPDGTRIVLDATFSREGQRKLKEVRKVTIKPPPVSVSAPLERRMSATTIAVDEPGGRGLRLLLAAGLDEAAINRITEADADIEVTVQLRFKSGRAVRAVPGPAIGRLLRNVEEDELTLEGPAGREREGRLVKLAYQATIAKQGEFLKRREVATSLYEAFTYFRRNGHIDA